MNRTALITGGAGFIGSNLAISLAAKGWKVRVLDSLSPQIHGEFGDSPTRKAAEKVAELVIGDVRDTSLLSQALEGVDAVIHLAAETGTGQSMYQIERYTDVNIQGTAGLLQILANNNLQVKRLVVASSRAIYGEGKYACRDHGSVYPSGRMDPDMAGGDFNPHCPICRGTLTLVPTDEDSKIHPNSVYGITKQVQEELVLQCGTSIGLPAIALRYQNVYGPGQSLCNPYTGILSIFSTRLRAGADVNIFEDGKESRDFVFIDDVVSATVAALDAAPDITGAFNVGSGKAVDVLTVANTLKEAFGSSGEIRVTGNYRVGDIRHNLADITQARQILGWSPRIAFEEGIKRFISWVGTQDTAHDGYEKSLQEMKDRGLFK